MLQNPSDDGLEKTEKSRMRTDVSNKIHRSNVTNIFNRKRYPGRLSFTEYTKSLM